MKLLWVSTDESTVVPSREESVAMYNELIYKMPRVKLHEHFPPVKFSSCESCLTNSNQKTMRISNIGSCKVTSLSGAFASSEEVYTAQSVWPCMVQNCWSGYVCIGLGTKVVVVPNWNALFILCSYPYDTIITIKISKGNTKVTLLQCCSHCAYVRMCVYQGLTTEG